MRYTLTNGTFFNTIGELELKLTRMPECTRTKEKCSMKNVPDLNGNCESKMINLFKTKSVHGWWPLYHNVDGEREMGVKKLLKGRILLLKSTSESLLEADFNMLCFPRQRHSIAPSSSFN